MNARAAAGNTFKYRLCKKDSPAHLVAEKKKEKRNFENKDALFQLNSSRGIFLGAKCTTEKRLCTTRDSSSYGEHQSVAKKKKKKKK